MVDEWSEGRQFSEPREDPRDLRVCQNCNEYFNARSAKLGAVNCPTCDRRMGNSW